MLMIHLIRCGRASRQILWEVLPWVVGPWEVGLAAVVWEVHRCSRTVALGSPTLACKDRARDRAALGSQQGLARCPWAILGS